MLSKSFPDFTVFLKMRRDAAIPTTTAGLFHSPALLPEGRMRPPSCRHRDNTGHQDRTGRVYYEWKRLFLGPQTETPVTEEL